MDQAEKLRNLVGQIKPPSANPDSPMRVISITSGKGGVGKTNFALNLAIYLAKTGKRITVIDADFGLANVEVLLGVSPRYTFKDVLSGQVELLDALTLGPEGVRFLSGGSGLAQLADITESQLSVILSGFTQLEEVTDILIIDTGAGINKAVINFLKASHEIIVVTTSDPTAIADAYAVIKTISDDNVDAPQLKIVINRVENQNEGVEVFGRLQRVCTRFLSVNPISLGNIPYDKYLSKAVKSQEPVALMYPYAESSKCIESICRKLLNEPELETTSVRRFIDRWVGFIKG